MCCYCSFADSVGNYSLAWDSSDGPSAGPYCSRALERRLSFAPDAAPVVTLVAIASVMISIPAEIYASPAGIRAAPVAIWLHHTSGERQQRTSENNKQS